jgi:hypothetical protein
MEIPKRFSLGHLTYKVEYNPTMGLDENQFAKIHPRRCVIQVCSEATFERKHERVFCCLMEILMAEAAISIDGKAVSRLAMWLYGLFRGNPHLLTIAGLVAANSARILGIDYTITRDNDQNEYGSYNPNEFRLGVNRNLPKARQAEYRIHELLHVAWRNLEIGDDEKETEERDIVNFAMLLTIFLHENDMGWVPDRAETGLP